MAELTQERLKELFDYDPTTGIFKTKVARGKVPAGRAYGSHNNEYVQIWVETRGYAAHRLAWLYVHGYFPKAPLEIDHIDRQKNNNRIANLREVTRSENRRNRVYIRRAK